MNDSPKLTLKRRKGGSFGADGQIIEIGGAMAERVAAGKNRLRITQGERKEIEFARLVERAVALLTDIENPISSKDIAVQLGISYRSFCDLTTNPAFIEKMNIELANILHDPQTMVAKAHVANRVGELVKSLLDTALGNNGAPWPVRMQAMKECLALSGINRLESGKSDKAEMTEFLKAQGIVVGTVNINQQQQVVIPQEYQDAMAKVIDADILEIRKPLSPAAVDPAANEDAPDDSVHDPASEGR